MRNAALTYTAAHNAEICETPEPEPPGDGEAVIRAEWSGLSRGTERLVFEGRVPESEWTRMRAPLQRGDFPFPVVYGYALVGVVEDGPPDWLGRRVFALAPHERRALLPLEMLTPLPEATPSRRAVLAANVETALNAAWDGGLSPGDRVAVVGAGVVGALVAVLAARTPGVELLIVDAAPARAALAEALGAAFTEPAAAPADFDADVVFHVSASEAGLASALALAGPEGVVVEMSWYGTRAPAAPLGAAFHSRRLALLSSQVGQVAARRRPRWSYGRRRAKAVELLADPAYEQVLTGEVRFEDLPSALPRLLARDADGLATAIRY